MSLLRLLGYEGGGRSLTAPTIGAHLPTAVGSFTQVLSFCAMHGFQVTLLKQNIGSMGRHIQTSADKEAKVGKSEAEDKENVNYVLVNFVVIPLRLILWILKNFTVCWLLCRISRRWIDICV